MEWFQDLNPVIQSFIATIFTWGITALGALVVCFFKEINKKTENIKYIEFKDYIVLQNEIDK